MSNHPSKQDILLAKQALDSLIKKARVHLYKPIQIAEILHRDRTIGDIDALNKETYRNKSKTWRDVVCNQFLGRTSSSSQKYQDDLFNDNAIPPVILNTLISVNRSYSGAVEAYIYERFATRFTQMNAGLDYCRTHTTEDFVLVDFINLFWQEAGLRRSIDKIYEMVVYALFSSLVQAMDVYVEIGFNPERGDILKQFSEFSKKVLGLTVDTPKIRHLAHVHRVGVTNAADRGLDMWSSFGVAIQIKHLSLTEELAEGIVQTVSSDRIVVVCKDAEQKLIVSLLNQLGWRAKIQSIITESELVAWYEEALRGEYASQTANAVLKALTEEIQIEFPATNLQEWNLFINERGYTELETENIW